MVFKPAYGKITVVIDDRPGGIGFGSMPYVPSPYSAFQGPSYEFLDAAADIHIHRIDPFTPVVLRGEAEIASAEEGHSVVGHREGVDVGLIAPQVGHAPEGENVAGGIELGFFEPAQDELVAPGIHIGPAGVDGLGQRARL